MLDIFQAVFGPALVQRLVLLANHVLSSEPVATERLRPHAGKLLQLNLMAWPAWLPAPPALALRVTPAGLLEWCGPAPVPQADLIIMLNAANPAGVAAALLLGQRPALEIDGDAALATELDWLLNNLRWDAAADVERLLSPQRAQPVLVVGAALMQGLRAALAAASSLSARLRQGVQRPVPPGA